MPPRADQEGYARWSRHLPLSLGEVSAAEWPRAQYASAEGIEALRLRVSIERRSVAAQRATAVQRALLHIPTEQLSGFELAGVPGAGLRIKRCPADATSDIGLRGGKFVGWWATHATSSAAARERVWQNVRGLREYEDWSEANSAPEQGYWLRVERREDVDTGMEGAGFVLDSQTVTWQKKLLHPVEMCALFPQLAGEPTRDQERLAQLRERLAGGGGGGGGGGGSRPSVVAASGGLARVLGAEERSRADDFFNRIDVDGDGVVLRGELLQALRSDGQVRRLFGLKADIVIGSEDYQAFEAHWNALDANSDAQVTHSEFLAWIADMMRGRVARPSAPDPPVPEQATEQRLAELCDRTVIATLTREDLAAMAAKPELAVRLGLCMADEPGAPPGAAPPIAALTDGPNDRPAPLTALLAEEPARCHPLSDTGDTALAALWAAQPTRGKERIAEASGEGEERDDGGLCGMLRRLFSRACSAPDPDGADQFAPEMWVIACLPDRGSSGSDPCVLWSAGRPQWRGRTRLLVRLRDTGGGVFVSQPPLTSHRTSRPYALKVRSRPGAPDLDVYRFGIYDEQPSGADRPAAPERERQEGEDLLAVAEEDGADDAQPPGAKARLQMLDRVVRQTAREMMNTANRDAAREGVGPPFAAEPQYNEMRVHYFGEIISASGFEVASLFIRMTAMLPEHGHGGAWWRHEGPVAGADSQGDSFSSDSASRFTQCAQPLWERDDEGRLTGCFTFGMPWSLNCLAAASAESFGGTFPRLLLQVYSERNPGSSTSPAQLEGYTHLDLAPVPGAHRCRVRCWRPRHSTRKHLREHFLGGSPELDDLSYTAVPSAFKEDFLNKFGFHVTSGGSVDVRWNCVVQTCSKYPGAQDCSDAWMADLRPSSVQPRGTVGQDLSGFPYMHSPTGRRRSVVATPDAQSILLRPRQPSTQIRRRSFRTSPDR